MSLIASATGLWKRSLGIEGPHAARLSGALITARDNVKNLLVGIPGDMKGYTVHDLSHLDALWEIADLIAGPDFELNPAEAFVFGIGVLLHDSAMTVMAYPGGIAELSETDTWKNQAARVGAGGMELSSIPSDLRATVVTNTLRTLHAEQAEKLATQHWSIGGSKFYIIDDADLRIHYGPIAGKIAHSHHWDSNSLLTKFSQTLGAFGDMPSTWTIDAVKVATLLRCSDAAHIDHRRAPRRLFAMAKPQGISETHWNFQSRLAKPYVRGDRLVYSSVESFGVDLVDAWYLCFDTAQMVDRELADAEENLRSRGSGFFVKGVYGIKSTSNFTDVVHVDGWKPVSVDIQVSDVPALASTLGGHALYSSRLAPIRELLQNAADSIDARTQIDTTFSKKHGLIVVRVGKQDDVWRIDVEDNGIGMSERVLTRALLDFGKSFWRSELIREEHPGLTTTVNNSRGKFGIGFFSVFMWATQVSAVSRKYTAAQSDTMALEFRGGISQRPILRQAHAREISSSVMTRVSLAVSEEIALTVLGRAPLEGDEHRLARSRRGWANGNIDDFSDPVTMLTAALDIDVSVEADGESRIVNNRNWKSLPEQEFISYISRISKDIDCTNISTSVSEIVEDGTVKGRALLVPDYMRARGGILLVHDKGITVSLQGGSGILGIVEGEVQNAARDRAKVSPLNRNDRWMSEQQEAIFASAPDAARQISAQKLLIAYHRYSPERILFVLNREMLSLNQVLDRISESGRVEMRLSEEHNEDFQWKKITELKVIVAIDINPNELFVLCDLPVGEIDEHEVRKMLGGSSTSSVAAKILSEIGRVLGPEASLTFQLVEQDGYSRRNDARISIVRNARNVGP